jgi:hypothetical protein
MLTGLDDPKFWQMRAEAARMLAEELKDKTAKAIVLRIAESYDSLEAHAVLNAKPARAPFAEERSPQTQT